MYDYTNHPTENRMSAPEIAMRAREYAKEQALLKETYRVQGAQYGYQRASRNLVVRLLAGLRLF